MSKASVILLSAGFISYSFAQPALLEIPQLLGECFPQYSANSNTLKLFQEPNLNSRPIHIQYQEDWLIPYQKSSAMTRVLATGQVQVSKREKLRQCSSSPADNEVFVEAGDTLTYLYYLGEGFAKVQSDLYECELFIDDDEVLEHPIIQAWIKVLYRDGTSPGWLLHSGDQTSYVRMLC